MWGGGAPSLQAKPAKTSRELNNAIADDLRKEQINDAKLKAMHDVVDYDTFKDRVSVAHLRPLGAPNTRQVAECSPASLFNADGSRAALESNVDASAAVAITAAGAATTVPTTSADFDRTWRRNCTTTQHKYNYLLLIPPPSYAEIFKIEISPTLLGAMLDVLSAHCPAEGTPEARRVCEVLAALPAAGRFSLTSKLLGSKPKACLASILDRLEAAAVDVSAVKANWK